MTNVNVVESPVIILLLNISNYLKVHIYNSFVAKERRGSRIDNRQSDKAVIKFEALAEKLLTHPNNEMRVILHDCPDHLLQEVLINMGGQGTKEEIKKLKKFYNI